MRPKNSKQALIPLLAFCIPWQGDADGYCIGDPVYPDRNLGRLVNDLMPYVFAVSGLVLLFMIIFSGYQLLTSAGNPEGMQKGKSRLTAALVGFIIIFAAFWIYQLIGVIIGYDFTNP